MFTIYIEITTKVIYKMAMDPCELQECLPGDVVSVSASAKLGPGLRLEEDGTVVATQGGLLRHRDRKAFWIDAYSKRYIPTKGDCVIGIITQVQRHYRVDIGSYSSATLGELAFEGATKRNKPNLQVGDLVYARLMQASVDLEPELTCVDGSGKANGLGPLKGSENAFLLHANVVISRRLVPRKGYGVLKALEKRGFKYEVVPGMNGRIWLDSSHLFHTIAIANAITLSEYMTQEEIERSVNEIGDNVGCSKP